MFGIGRTPASEPRTTVLHYKLLVFADEVVKFDKEGALVPFLAHCFLMIFTREIEID